MHTYCTVCPRCVVPIFIVTNYTKWVETSWIYSSTQHYTNITICPRILVFFIQWIYYLDKTSWTYSCMVIYTLAQWSLWSYDSFHASINIFFVLFWKLLSSADSCWFVRARSYLYLDVVFHITSFSESNTCRITFFTKIS